MFESQIIQHYLGARKPKTETETKPETETETVTETEPATETKTELSQSVNVTYN
jgi:hypothetical protein